MGYNIGLRLIEDFLAKTNTGRCANFRETAEMISKVPLRSYKSRDAVLADTYPSELGRIQDLLEHHAGYYELVCGWEGF